MRRYRAYDNWQPLRKRAAYLYELVDELADMIADHADDPALVRGKAATYKWHLEDNIKNAIRNAEDLGRVLD